MKHIPGLDGIRGIGILLVVGLHGGIRPFGSGFVGVDLFFVLSGFLITRIVLHGWSKPGGLALGDFYRRRLLRIVPGLYALLILLTLVVALGGTRWKTGQYYPLLPWAATFTMPWHMIATTTNNHLGHLWSVSIEMWFYMVAPWIAWFFTRSRACATATIAASLAAIGYGLYARTQIFAMPPTAGYVEAAMGLLRPDGLVIGALVAVATRRWNRPAKGVALAAWIALPVLVGVVFWMPTMLLLREYLIVVLLCGAAWVAHLAVNPPDFISRLFEWKPLRWVGEISYSLYLWHPPIASIVKAWKLSTRAETIAVYLAISFAVAALSYYVVERPFLKRGRTTDPSFHPGRPAA